MSQRRCRYCQQLFQPSRFRPQQEVCSQLLCQRQRRRDYHRQKLAADPVYRQVCLESPRKWRQAHTDYWKKYRRDHPQKSERNRQQQHLRDQKRGLVNLANNNLAFDLKHSAAEVWLLGPATQYLANNNLAPCQVLVFSTLGPGTPSVPAPCKQQPSGVSSVPDL
jgi:hypothetical protein